MIVVCLLFLVLSLVGTAIDLCIKVFQWIMEKPEEISGTESDNMDSAEEDTPLTTQFMAMPSNMKNANKKLTFFHPLRNLWNSLLLFPLSETLR